MNKTLLLGMALVCAMGTSTASASTIWGSPVAEETQNPLFNPHIDPTTGMPQGFVITSDLEEDEVRAFLDDYQKEANDYELKIDAAKKRIAHCQERIEFTHSRFNKSLNWKTSASYEKVTMLQKEILQAKEQIQQSEAALDLIRPDIVYYWELLEQFRTKDASCVPALGSVPGSSPRRRHTAATSPPASPPRRRT